ncbi:MAG: DNA N-6-adenine-methyltransferase [Rhodospirillaceae bacterium]
MTAHVKHNSGNNEWYTPPNIIEAAREVFGGTIHLDPASSPVANQTVGAGVFFTKEDDGLTRDWRFYGNIWLNPPYSRDLFPAFVKKVVDEVKGKARMLVLVNNGTETLAGQMLLGACDAVCFLHKRVRYLDETGKPKYTPLQGQMVLSYNNDTERFASVFGKIGVVLWTQM